tara:strand:- start:56 stop:175 length:120 start_codon:yes stop_codon:yes gene_type:complete
VEVPHRFTALKEAQWRDSIRVFFGCFIQKRKTTKEKQPS